MENMNVCPCPNLDCANHGDCQSCTSRHLRIGSLSYCAFYSILDELQDAIKASPESPAAIIIKNRIEKQTEHYSRCMERNEISENQINILKYAKSIGSNH